MACRKGYAKYRNLQKEKLTGKPEGKSMHGRTSCRWI